MVLIRHDLEKRVILDRIRGRDYEVKIVLLRVENERRYLGFPLPPHEQWIRRPIISFTRRRKIFRTTVSQHVPRRLRYACHHVEAGLEYAVAIIIVFAVMSAVLARGLLRK